MNGDLIRLRGGKRIGTGDYLPGHVEAVNAKLNAIAQENDQEADISAAIEHLDFEPHCGVVGRIKLYQIGPFVVEVASNEQCLERAAWIESCLHCKKSKLVCDAHHDEMAASPSLMCGRCSRLGEPNEVFLWIPLGVTK